MSTYKVEICGVNTAKLPLLSDEEKNELWDKIKAGDAQARETYIKGNLRLVLSVLKRFSGHGENLDDLFQIGCIGLIKSIDNFDPTMNVKFSTYAVPMIIGEIRRYLRDDGMLKVSRNLKENCARIYSAREALEKEGIPMAQAEVTMIPQNYVELSADEDITNINRILDLLDDDDDVQQVYHNWDE